MKRVLFVLILFVFAICFTSVPSFAADGFTGNINFIIGKKTLNEDDWAPLDSQTEYGINVDFGRETWPVHIDLAYISSSDDQEMSGDDLGLGDMTFDTEASTTELRLGVKYIFDSSPTMRPYVAGGIANVNGEIEVSLDGTSMSTDESAVGLYLATGIYWTIAGQFNLGAELGYSFANIDMMDYEADAGGGHLLALIGYHF